MIGLHLSGSLPRALTLARSLALSRSLAVAPNNKERNTRPTRPERGMWHHIGTSTSVKSESLPLSAAGSPTGRGEAEGDPSTAVEDPHPMGLGGDRTVPNSRGGTASNASFTSDWQGPAKFQYV